MQYGIPVFEFIAMTTLLLAFSAQQASAQEDAREESRQTFPLSSASRVEVLKINGPVIIQTSDSDVAEVEIVRQAKRPRHLKYHLVSVEHTPTSLIIQGKEDRTAYRRGVAVQQQVTLKIPRRASLVVRGIGGPVQIGELEGPVEVEQVSGSLKIGPVAGALEISNIGGGVEVRVAENLNAELTAKSIGGGLYVNLPNVERFDPESAAVSMTTRIGAGGTPISIVQVSGAVRLTHGF